MNADKILRKHEDANEMHFHDVDRQWIIEAMEEYASKFLAEISDEEIEDASFEYKGDSSHLSSYSFTKGAKWYREQLKQKQ